MGIVKIRLLTHVTPATAGAHVTHVTPATAGAHVWLHQTRTVDSGLGWNDGRVQ